MDEVQHRFALWSLMPSFLLFFFLVCYYCLLVLATCSALSTDEQVHDNVVLTQVRNGQRLDSLRHNVEWKHRPFAGAINSLAFGGKSRYLCIGDESGAVCIWDLKKRLRVRQFFHDGHPSRQVSLDPTDTYIFSLAPRKFSIYMLKEGTAVRAFHLPPPQPGSGNGGVFTRYHTSALEPNLTAIGTSEGIIHIYDVHQPTHQSNQPIFSFGTRRNSYVTGLAFSPNNSKYLFVSDQEGFLTLYDKNTGQSLHTIASLNESIMAMKMHTNGYLVAVGTERGQVLVYDIRQQSTNMMVASMLVQNGPVTCIQFAPPPKASSTKNGGQQPNAVAQQSSIDETNQYSGPPPPSDNRKQSSPSQKQQQPQTSPAANGKPKMHVPSLSEIQSAKENLSSSQNIEPMNGRRSQSPSPAKQQKPPLPQQQPPQEPAARRQQQQIVVDDQSKASGSTQAYSLQPQQVVGVNSSGSVPSLVSLSTANSPFFRFLVPVKDGDNGHAYVGCEEVVVSLIRISPLSCVCALF